MSPLLIAILAVLAAIGLVFVFYGYFVLLLLRYREPVRADEVHTIPTEDLWQIKLYRRKPKKGKGEPVLLCHSMSSNHLNFEVPAGESMVDVLCEAGYDCWTIDTRACRSAIAPSGTRKLSATMDDILLKDLPAAIAFIQEKTGFKRVHWVGHSMGGMMLYAYVLKFGSDHIASAVTLGSPPGFQNVKLPNHGVLNTIAPFTFGIMSFFFRGLVPFATVVHPKSKLVPINWDNISPTLTNADLFYALEMPMPRIGSEMNGWASKGVWRMCADTLDVQERLPELDVPLFAIFGGSDPLAPPEAAESFFDSLRIKDKKMAILSELNGASADYNHIELVFALNGREEVFEPAVEWLRAHPVTGRRADTPSAGSRTTRKPAAPRKKATAAKTAAAKKPAAKTAAKPKAKPKVRPKAVVAAPKKKAAAKKPAAKPKAKKKPAAKKRSSG